MGCFFGNEVTIDNAKHKFALSQSHYILSCLDCIGMIDCNGVALPLRNHLSFADQPNTPVHSIGESYVMVLLYH